MRLGNRSVDPLGNVVFEDEGLVDLLMCGGGLSGELDASDSPGVQRYNQLCRELDHPGDRVAIYEAQDVDPLVMDAQRQSQWFTPESWRSMDLQEHLLLKCHTEEQVARVLEEWEMFQQRDMLDVLYFLAFMIHDFRERGVVWGVGRGSSVASYCLFLLEVHRVDSLAFGLNIQEFLK